MEIDSERLGALLKEELFADVEQSIRHGRSVTIMVRGWSMCPLLRNLKDKVELFPITEALKCGDVVVFKYRGRVLLHRIVRVSGDSLLIRGDGVPFHYETAACGDVLAIMKTVIKGSGKRITTDSLEWMDKSRKWGALPPVIQYLIIKPIVFIDRLLNK